MNSTKKIPIRINKCPIIEAIVDFRFDTRYPPDSIFGIIYKSFESKFDSEVKKLPILQIPEQIRVKDKNLIYQPYYRLSDKNFLMQIGPKVLSFINIGSYMGWNTFYGRIKESLQIISSLDLSLNINRIGIRYINYFNFDIFNRITLSIAMGNKPLLNKHLAIRAVLDTGKYQTNLNILNNANLQTNHQLLFGSTIDIDTYLEGKAINLSSDTDDIIGDAHDEEKKLFFNLLNNDLIEELEPVYEEGS